MKSTVHLSSVVIVITLLSPQTFWENLAFLIGGVFLDGDYIFTFLLEEKNHRTYISHSFLFWSLVTFLIVNLYYFNVIGSNMLWLGWLIGGILLHLFLDFWDWGLPLFPLTSFKPILPHLLNLPAELEGVPDIPERLFNELYWKNPWILAIELFLTVTALIAVILTFTEITVLYLITGVIAYPIVLRGMVQSYTTSAD